jgi:hypothetical protein
MLDALPDPHRLGMRRLARSNRTGPAEGCLTTGLKGVHKATGRDVRGQEPAARQQRGAADRLSASRVPVSA